MGLLDDLKKEADDARSRREREDAGGRRRAAAAEARLGPALTRAERYFEQLAAQLGDIGRVVETGYEIAEVGRLDGLQQSGYATSSDEHRAGSGFRFVFRCTGRVPVQARFTAEPVAANVERVLRDARLTVRRVEETGPSIVLRVEPEVPVSLVFSMDVEQGSVVLNARNLFGIGMQSHRFAPEQVNGELLDALGHCVLREPGRFAELTGNAVDAAQRRRLQRDSARRQRRRDAELGGPLRRLWYVLSEAARRLFAGQ